MIEWFDAGQHPARFALLLTVVSVALSYTKSAYEKRQFRLHSRPRILAVLRQHGPLSEHEILERDYDISDHGVIDPGLYEMEKEGVLRSRRRTNKIYEFVIVTPDAVPEKDVA